MVATRTTPGIGAQPDDPADQGQVYNLNLAIPAAGNYVITTTYPDNATLYRNNGGVTGYPFSAGNTFAITGNNATSTANAADTTYYRNFYYYFYNLKVQSLGCPGIARVAVNIIKPTITLTRTSLISNFVAGNQWHLNGIAIPGATGQTYIPVAQGIYRVDVTNVNGCTSKSDDFSLITPLITQSGNTLTSSYAIGNQWYMNGVPISGANRQNYMPPYSGVYEVYVTLSTGFVLKSNDFNFVLPAKDNSSGSEISLAVFPVPTSGLIKIAFMATAAQDLTITVVTTIGQTAYKFTKQIPAGGYYQELDLSALTSGEYIVRFNIGDKKYTKKIVIAK